MGRGYYDAKRRKWVNSPSDCGCYLHRRKFGLLRKDEKEELKKEKRVKHLERCYPLQDIPLFCRVFPEGIVGDCGFKWFGFCAVFEDGCVRWNELGDKMDYSVGEKNPFEDGE